MRHQGWTIVLLAVVLLWAATFLHAAETETDPSIGISIDKETKSLDFKSYLRSINEKYYTKGSASNVLEYGAAIVAVTEATITLSSQRTQDSALYYYEEFRNLLSIMQLVQEATGDNPLYDRTVEELNSFVTAGSLDDLSEVVAKEKLKIVLEAVPSDMLLFRLTMSFNREYKTGDKRLIPSYMRLFGDLGDTEFANALDALRQEEKGKNEWGSAKLLLIMTDRSNAVIEQCVFEPVLELTPSLRLEDLVDPQTKAEASNRFVTLAHAYKISHGDRFETVLSKGINVISKRYWVPPSIVSGASGREVKEAKIADYDSPLLHADLNKFAGYLVTSSPSWTPSYAFFRSLLTLGPFAYLISVPSPSLAVKVSCLAISSASLALWFLNEEFNKKIGWFIGIPPLVISIYIAGTIYFRDLTPGANLIAAGLSVRPFDKISEGLRSFLWTSLLVLGTTGVLYKRYLVNPEDDLGIEQLKIILDKGNDFIVQWEIDHKVKMQNFLLGTYRSTPIKGEPKFLDYLNTVDEIIDLQALYKVYSLIIDPHFLQYPRADYNQVHKAYPSIQAIKDSLIKSVTDEPLNDAKFFYVQFEKHLDTYVDHVYHEKDARDTTQEAIYLSQHSQCKADVLGAASSLLNSLNRLFAGIPFYVQLLSGSVPLLVENNIKSYPGEFIRNVRDISFLSEHLADVEVADQVRPLLKKGKKDPFQLVFILLSRLQKLYQSAIPKIFSRLKEGKIQLNDQLVSFMFDLSKDLLWKSRIPLLKPYGLLYPTYEPIVDTLEGYRNLEDKALEAKKLKDLGDIYTLLGSTGERGPMQPACLAYASSKQIFALPLRLRGSISRFPSLNTRYLIPIGIIIFIVVLYSFVSRGTGSLSTANLPSKQSLIDVITIALKAVTYYGLPVVLLLGGAYKMWGSPVIKGYIGHIPVIGTLVTRHSYLSVGVVGVPLVAIAIAYYRSTFSNWISGINKAFNTSPWKDHVHFVTGSVIATVYLGSGAIMHFLVLPGLRKIDIFNRMAFSFNRRSAVLANWFIIPFGLNGLFWCKDWYFIFMNDFILSQTKSMWPVSKYSKPTIIMSVEVGVTAVAFVGRLVWKYFWRRRAGPVPAHLPGGLPAAAATGKLASIRRTVSAIWTAIAARVRRIEKKKIFVYGALYLLPQSILLYLGHSILYNSSFFGYLIGAASPYMTRYLLAPVGAFAASAIILYFKYWWSAFIFSVMTFAGTVHYNDLWSLKDWNRRMKMFAAVLAMLELYLTIIRTLISFCWSYRFLPDFVIVVASIGLMGAAYFNNNFAVNKKKEITLLFNNSGNKAAVTLFLLLVSDIVSFPLTKWLKKKAGGDTVAIAIEV